MRGGSFPQSSWMHLQELALALDLDLLAGVVRVGGVEVQVATVRRLGNMGE